MNNEFVTLDLWEQFAELHGGVLVVGHGTRNASGVQELIALVEAMGKELPGTLPIEASFLELAKPTIEEAIERLELSGCRQLLVIPILLFTAAHARQDIPEAVQAALASKPMQLLAQSTALGTDEAALKLSETRFLHSLECRNVAGCLKAGACNISASCKSNIEDQSDSNSEMIRKIQPRENVDRVRIGLAMVGRGTSDPEAREHMIRLSQLRVSSSPVKIQWSQTGFFAGGTPDVSQLINEADKTDCEWIVVQPHLLFEGQLSEQLRAMVDEKRVNGSQKRWLVAPTLGADPLLATTFLELGKKALSQAILN